VTIEKLKKGEWYKRLMFQSLNHYGCIYFKDINNDGLIDIAMEGRFSDEVYFYNPKINNFIKSVCCEINDDIHLIDPKHNIYCYFQQQKSMCGQINSALYTIKNFEKRVLFNLELVNCNKKREYCDIKTLILSKCVNGNEEDLEEIETIQLKSL
jgi:hypothetical protein